jgi:hypothetical protein
MQAIAALLLSAVAAAPAAPSPADAPETRAFRYSEYEEATIADALQALGLARDDAPAGKVVESIQTVRLEVIEKRDPAPRLLNAFHVLSRGGVLAREVLLRPGAPYQQTLADETRRNLAALPQLSLVLVVAARGSSQQEVSVIVIT